MEDYKSSVLGLVPRNWEVKRFDEIYSFKRTKSLSRSQLTTDTAGKELYIHYGDIHSTFQFPILDLHKQKLPRVKNSTALSDDLDLLQDGDLVIADASEDLEGVGKCVELKNVGNLRVIGGLHTFVCRDENNFTAKGIGPYLLENPLVKKSIKQIATGASVLGLSKKNIAKINILLPSVPEQHKMADILSTVDEKIEIINQQILDTEELKIGLMQRLLTKGIGHSEYKSSTLGKIPRNWESLSMDEIADITSSKRIHKKDYVTQGIPFFRGKEITLLANRTGLKDIVYIQKETFDKLKKKFGAPEPGDILITAVGTIGSIYMVGKSDEFYFKDGNLMWLRDISSQINSTYLLYFLRSELFQNEIKNTSSGSSQSALTIIKFKKLFINIPPLSEQQKIGEILITVDDKIESLKMRLRLCHEMKKSLIQQLMSGRIRINHLIEV